MLHTETLEGTTLELLRNLGQEEMLSSFSLAGGTAPPLPFNAVVLKDF